LVCFSAWFCCGSTIAGFTSMHDKPLAHQGLRLLGHLVE
jgi:hypothetical protein